MQQAGPQSQKGVRDRAAINAPSLLEFCEHVGPFKQPSFLRRPTRITPQRSTRLHGSTNMRNSLVRSSWLAIPWAMILAFTACEINDPIWINGTSCTDGAQCVSGFCVDGLCCDTECSGTCQACSATKKGSGMDGTCENLQYATDPDNECPTGACSGSATCQFDNGVACVNNADCLSNDCVDGVCCNEVCDGPCRACSAAKKGGGTDGTCDFIAVDTDPDNECAMGHCDGTGVCSVLAANGTSCNVDSECQSNACASGVCCNNACSNACYACDVPGMEGTCTLTCTPSSCTSLGLPDPPTIPGFRASSYPTSMASADFNGDGLIDIVTTDEYKPFISVMLATGNSTFAANVDYGAASSACSIIAADLNGDGKPDLVAGNLYGTNVSVYINLGNGTFAARVDQPVGTSPKSVAAADFNGDGKNDIVAANFKNNTVSVLMNNGNGTFAPQIVYATSSEPRAVAAVDLNGDGKIDIATANGHQFPSSNVSVLMNTGNGTFAAKVDYSAVSSAIAIAAADFTGDGKPDLAVTSYSDKMAVLPNNGNGTFAPKVDYTITNHNDMLVPSDIDDDGDTDLISASTYSFYVSVHSNQNGAFAMRSDYLSPGPVKALSVFDATGDGKRDIVAGYFRGSILPNLGDGTFPVEHVPNFGTGLGQPIVVDVNNDGKLDFVAPSTQSSAVVALMNDGSGSFSNTYTSAAAGSAIGSVAAGDFNGDGLQDLVTTHGNMYSILLNQGNNTFVQQSSNGTWPGINAVTTGDFNGDGRVDIAWATFEAAPLIPKNQPGYNRIFMTMGNGDGTFSGSYSETWPSYVQCGGFGQQLAAADFDNDGAQELAFAHCDWNAVRIMKPNMSGKFDTVGSANVEKATSVKLGDFNGDGMFDLVTTAITGINVFMRQGPFSFAAPVAYPGYGYIALADLNDDGNLDLVSKDRTNAIAVFLNHGNGAFAAAADYLSGLNPSGTVSGDWNGDGRDDVAFNTEGTIGVMLSMCLP